MPNPASTLVGVVEELWRYPVKSMIGEQLTATEVTESGLLGDRAYALRDTSDGKIATAKNPRKWPNLFDYGAALTGAATAGEKLPPARITLPDGTTISTEQPDDARMLSAALKRQVRLKRSSVIGGTQPRPTRRRPRSTGWIWKAWSTGTRSPTSTCPRVLFSTLQPSTS
jgi:uncharacterized protein YcbX